MAKFSTFKKFEKFESLKNSRFLSNLFSFTQELAMDLGTANTVIISDGKIAVNEPSSFGRYCAKAILRSSSA